MKTLVESAEKYLMEDGEVTQSGVKLFVKSMSKEVVQDSYEQGEQGDRQLQLDEKIGKTFDSFDDFKKYAEKMWYFKNSDSAWVVIDNRIIYDQLENGDGDSVDEGDPEFSKWKSGEVELWNATYDFVCELIVPSNTDEEALRAFTGIKN